jgi:hypothetical protein
MPTTYVYAKELSTDGILEGLKQGRAYVTKGPQVSFMANLGDSMYMIGDDLGEQGGEMKFFATVTNITSKVQVQLIKCGEVVSKIEIDSKTTDVNFSDQVNSEESVWYALNVADQNGDSLAITNPIYAGPLREPKLNLYSDFLSG